MGCAVFCRAVSFGHEFKMSENFGQEKKTGNTDKGIYRFSHFFFAEKIFPACSQLARLRNGSLTRGTCSEENRWQGIVTENGHQAERWLN